MRIQNSDGYDVRLKQGFREVAWVEYEEGGRTLSLWAEWTVASPTELVIELSEKVFFPPDYENPLSEARILEIQKRISENLDKLKIRHAFMRLGWTTLR